jgi:hypothetical protein
VVFLLPQTAVSAPISCGDYLKIGLSPIFKRAVFWDLYPAAYTYGFVIGSQKQAFHRFVLHFSLVRMYVLEALLVAATLPAPRKAMAAM